jgi:hypothetical protein
MEFSAGTFVTILIVIGLLALIVSVLTEVTKGVVQCLFHYMPYVYILLPYIT